MIRVIAVIVFALSLISCGTTGGTPASSTSDSSAAQSSALPQSAVNLPDAAPDESWVWGDRGCCQMTTADGAACYENTTKNWCDSSKPTFANANWREDTKCKYVSSCPE